MGKHSPGTWLVDDDLDVELGGSGAWALLNNNDPECKANAHLISAAPDLLAAVAHMLGAAESDNMDDNSNVWRSYMIDARAAITKATGETV